MKKLYIVEYATKCRCGRSRNYRKLVETEDIESYIKSNFLIGYTYSRGTKMFVSASEVQKVDSSVEKYVKVDGGTRWYGYPITLFEYELKSSVQKVHHGEYFNCKLQEFWSIG